MSLYAELRADLSAMFAEEPFVAATITRELAGAYDPRTRRTAEGSAQTISCRAVADARTIKSMDGVRSTLIEIVLNVEPKIADKITIGNKTFTVSRVTTIAPDGGEALVHTAEASL